MRWTEITEAADASHYASIADLVRCGETIGVEATVFERADEIELDRIDRQQDAPAGRGAEFISALCRYADRARKPISLTVTGRNDQLERYYRRFGFRPVRRSRDQETGDVVMVRLATARTEIAEGRSSITSDGANSDMRWHQITEAAEASGKRKLARLVSRLPKIMLKAGTPLYHGTDATASFEIPRGPAFFTEHDQTVSQWMSWAGHRDGHHLSMSRLMEFEVLDDIEILDLNYKGHDTFEKLCKAADLSGFYPPAMAVALRGLANGWVMPREVMLIDPGLILKAVRTIYQKQTQPRP